MLVKLGMPKLITSIFLLLRSPLSFPSRIAGNGELSLEEVIQRYKNVDPSLGYYKSHSITVDGKALGPDETVRFIERWR